MFFIMVIFFNYKNKIYNINQKKILMENINGIFLLVCFIIIKKIKMSSFFWIKLKTLSFKKQK